MTDSPGAGPIEWAVYLLHFEQEVDGSRHYAGITVATRLHQRMLEHTTGRGSAYTASRAQIGEPWRLARFWLTPDRALERRIIARAEARQLCPICRGLSSGIGYSPTKTAAGLRQRPSSIPNNYGGSQLNLDLGRVVKKEAGTRAAPSSRFSGQP